MATKMYGATQGEFKSTVGTVTATEHGGVHIEVSITDKSGKVVGKTTREWVVPEGAKTDQLSVRQGALEAEPWVPAGGLSRQMNAQAYAAYRAMGVPDVHVDAKGAVGSAGWAMAGYDFSTKGELDGVVRQFRKAAQAMEDGPVKAHIQALIARSTPESWKLGDHPSPLEFAMAGADVPTTRATKGGRQVQTWAGRDIMGGTSWKGRHNPARTAVTAAAGPDAPAPRDREAFLADVADADIGWAKAAADQVPAVPGLYDDPDYAEHHHLFTAPPEVSDEYRKMMAAVMAKHGRTDAGPAPADAEALVAHAGCDEYCRNPLHPGPCRGWRRQVDVAPEARRDRMPEAEHRRERNRQTREARRTQRQATAPPPAPARREGEHALPTGERGSDGFAPAPEGRELGTPDRLAAVSTAVRQQENDWSDMERARLEALRNRTYGMAPATAPIPPGPPSVGYRTNAAIAAQQGFDAKPVVATDAQMDAAIAAGGVEFWRGMSDAWGPDERFKVASTTGVDMVEQMRSGPAYWGYGVYGNGMYGGDDHRVAIEYAANTRFGWPTGGAAQSDGAVVRAVLRPGSRVVEFSDAKRERGRWVDAMRNHMVDQRMTPQQRSDFRVHIDRMEADLGVWAAMMGYDAIYADEARYVASEGDNSRHWNILNRGALMVSETTEPVVRGQTATPAGRRG